MIQSTSEWVEEALASLLSAPHISLSTIPGIPMGPGPIDLFSTKFNNTFTSDAKGIVDGEQIDRDGLKEKLLDLQRHYNPDTVMFYPAESDSSSQDELQDESQEKVQVSFEWTTKDSTEFEVRVGAIVVTQDGGNRISSLSLQGNPELFRKPGALIGEF